MTTFSGHLTDAQAQRLLDGALEPSRDGGVESHLAGCAECQALVESYRALCEALGGLDAELPPLPDDFTAAVLAGIDLRERAVARDRRLAFGILAGVLAAAVAVFAVAGAGAWAPTLSGWADGLGSTARAVRIGAGFVPTVVHALRLQILLAAAAVALPLLIAFARLMPAPAPRTETA
ncbi:MAG TPA: anti-sigma factor [Anaeromyxobacter sp.]